MTSKTRDSSNSSNPSYTPIAPTLSHSLEVALRLPRANRAVSDFLFSSLLQSPFHRNHPLPPQKLATSISLFQLQSIHTLPNRQYPPSAIHTPFPEHLLRSNPPSGDTVMTCMQHAIYIPVATLPPSFTLGYFLQHDPEHGTICFCANPFAPPCAGRFVFDSRSGDFLLTVAGGSPKSIGIRGTINTTHGCTEQYIIAVPALEYEWPNLPTTPLWMISHIAYRTKPAEHSSRQSQSPSDLTTFYQQQNSSNQSDNPFYVPPSDVLDAVDSALPLEPFPSRRDQGRNNLLVGYEPCFHPWVQEPSDRGKLSDGTSLIDAICKMDSTTSTCLSAGSLFDENKMKIAATELQKALGGSFYSPSLRMDSPASYDYSSTFTGRELITAMAVDGREMREKFAAMYYIDVLSASSPDEHLLSRAVVPGCVECTKAREVEAIQEKIESRQKFVPTDPSTYVDKLIVDKLAEEVLPWLGEEGLNLEINLQCENGQEASSKSAGDQNGSGTELSSGNGIGPSSLAIVGVPKPRLGPMRKLAPRPLALGPVTTVERGDGDRSLTSTSTSVMKYKSREEMLAARKARNRLSAARSNDRKKRMVEALENDLAEGKEKVLTLKKKQDQVIEENIKLRRQFSLQKGREELEL